MKIVRFLAAAAAIAGVAAPAAAQSGYPYPYPQQQYPQYPQQYPQYPQQYPQSGYGYPGQQGYGGNNVVSQVINQLLGNRYNVTDRNAVSQCASAALAQARARSGGYNGYNQQGYGQPYGQQYAYQGNARVTAITNVERRNNGLRVRGLISSGMGGGYGNYGYGQGGYGNPAYAGAAADLSFRCNVDYRGAVTNVRVRRAETYRG